MSFDACLDDGHGVGDSVCDPAHAAGDGGFDAVEHARAELDERGFEVAGGSLDGAGGCGGFHGGVGEAERHDRVVEFLRGDLPVGHRVAEVAGVGSGLLECLLDFAARAGDRVRELVPVLGREFSLAGGLRQHHRHGLEGVGGAAGDGVEVACGFGELVVVGHAVGGELGGGVADVVEVVDGLVGVVLRAGGESFDLLFADAGEVQCAGELLGAVGGAGDLAGQAHERFDGLARDALRDAGDDAEFRAEAPAKPLPALMPAVLPAVSDALPNADSMALPTPSCWARSVRTRWRSRLPCYASLMVVRGAARYAASCSSSIAMTSPPVASCRTVPGRWSCPRQRAPCVRLPWFSSRRGTRGCRGCRRGGRFGRPMRGAG